MSGRDYYERLGVQPTATDEQIRSAYRLLAKMFHPDRFDPRVQSKEWNKAHEMLLELNEAYQVLKDPKSRARYDSEAKSTTESAKSGTDRVEHANRPPDDETTTADREQPRPTKTYWNHSLEELPIEVQQRLLERQSGSDNDSLVYTLSRGLKPLFLQIASGVWLILMFFLANDWRWPSDTQVWYWFLCTGSGAVLLLSSRAQRRWNHSRLKSFLCFRPLYVIRAELDRVEWWLRSSMNLCRSTDHFSNGMLTRTSLQVGFENSKRRITIRSISRDALLELGQKLDKWNQRLEVAQRQGDANTFFQLDDFREFWTTPTAQKSEETPIRRQFWRRIAIEASIGALIGSFLFFAANYANDYFDDQKRWEEALSANSASSYRKYLAAHSTGRYESSAQEHIQQLYSKAQSDYSAGLSQGFEPDAQSAILQLLDMVKQGNDWNVHVIFDRNNRIPPVVEQLVAGRYKVSDVIPMGDSFSEQKLRQRETRIVNVVNEAFARIIPQDILQFSTDPGDGNRARFYVGYTIALGKGLYYRESDASIEESRRPYYPGISIEWEFEIRDPSNHPLYAFSIESEPAERFEYRVASSEQGAVTERPAIYDAMAESAFADLQNAMIRKLGVRGKDQ